MVHISVLPALFTLAVAVHLLLVKRLKMAPSPFRKGPEPEPTRPFTHHLGELAALGLVLIGVLTVLAVLLPPGHGPAPVEGLEVTKPPWPLLWVYSVEDWVGVAGILWATLAIFAALLLGAGAGSLPPGAAAVSPMWPSPRWRAPPVDPPKTIARGLGRIEWCGAAGSCQSGEVPNPAGVELPLFR